MNELLKSLPTGVAIDEQLCPADAAERVLQEQLAGVVVEVVAAFLQHRPVPDAGLLHDDGSRAKRAALNRVEEAHSPVVLEVGEVEAEALALAYGGSVLGDRLRRSLCVCGTVEDDGRDH
jgi:hypothetical protein